MGKTAKLPLVYTVLGYVLFGVIVALAGAIFVATAAWCAYHHVTGQSFTKWGGLTINTLGLYGWVVKQCRRFWRNEVFWWTILALVLVHTACFWVILRDVEQWRLAYFLAMYPIELPLIARALDWTTTRFGRGHQTVAAHHGMRSGAGGD